MAGSKKSSIWVKTAVVILAGLLALDIGLAVGHEWRVLEEVTVAHTNWYYLNTSVPLAVGGSGFEVEAGEDAYVSLICGFCYWNASIVTAEVSPPFVLVGFWNEELTLNATVDSPVGYSGNLTVVVLD